MLLLQWLSTSPGIVPLTQLLFVVVLLVFVAAGCGPFAEHFEAANFPTSQGELGLFDVPFFFGFCVAVEAGEGRREKERGGEMNGTSPTCSPVLLLLLLL